ncbi:response regulator transcription factor [Lentzea nigeriaca]|uniref:response regulator transcription factor n=1 Tax=Lentzea nigeriaca TaxID=1128665 RepID=UPI00195A2C94|nr:response regulator transcription factor [Lentzea nigeriaca]MBM7857175.1 DNA-binding NarL/FixJ family response regulator [Lentzea nigeriaca]
MRTHNDFHNGVEVTVRRLDAPDLTRIFLVDDHQMLRDALAARLSLAPGVCVVGGAAVHDPLLLERIAALRPNVVTVEIGHCGAEPAQLLDELAGAIPDGHVVALTDCTQTKLAVTAARAGVIAWVPKESTIDHLIGVLRAAGLGQASYPAVHLGEVLRALRADVRRARERTGPLDTLSRREREVLASMVEGKRRAEIARELSVSTNTVRTHTHKILTKLGVRSSLDAIRIAMSSGMRPPSASRASGQKS